MSGPLMWFANRGTGTVLLVLFTMTTVLGIASTARWTSTWWPRFLTQGLHRTVGLMASILLVAHVTTAVVDEYVDIRWFDAILLRCPLPAALSLPRRLRPRPHCRGRADRPAPLPAVPGRVAWGPPDELCRMGRLGHPLPGHRHRCQGALVPDPRHRVRWPGRPRCAPSAGVRSRSGPRRRTARYPRRVGVVA